MVTAQKIRPDPAEQPVLTMQDFGAPAEWSQPANRWPRAPHVRRGDHDNRKAARTPAGTAIGVGSERGEGMRAAQSRGMARY